MAAVQIQLCELMSPFRRCIRETRVAFQQADGLFLACPTLFSVIPVGLEIQLLTRNPKVLFSVRKEYFINQESLLFVLQLVSRDHKTRLFVLMYASREPNAWPISNHKINTVKVRMEGM